MFTRSGPDPECAMHERMAAAALPGPRYEQVLAAIHQHLKPRTYLEIGVESGKAIALAGAQTRAIGVDPQPKISVPLGRNVQIVRTTSDEFFARPDVAALFAPAGVELAFIDGQHLFEFALRDFAAIERLADPGGTILLHDCYPLDRRTAERERVTTFWSGDVWRVVLALKKHRPDLAIHTIATRPTGLAMVRNLDPRSTLLAGKMDAIVAEWLAVDYAVLDTDKPRLLNAFPNDPARLAALLADKRQ